MKLCKKCNTTKPTTEFYTNNASRDKLTQYCKSCCKDAERDYHKRNPSKKKFRNRRHMLVNGSPISDSIFNKMLENQSGNCGICETKMELPCIDHDHRTGEVRMLLCQQCNSIIGMANDDVDRLQKSIAYLNKFV